MFVLLLVVVELMGLLMLKQHNSLIYYCYYATNNLLNGQIMQKIGIFMTDFSHDFKAHCSKHCLILYDSK